MRRLLNVLIVLCAAMICWCSVALAAGHNEQVVEYFSCGMEAKQVLCQVLADRWRGKDGMAGGHFAILKDEGGVNGNVDSGDSMGAARRAVSVLRDLGELAGVSTDSWAVVLQDSERINAFALPGYIFVVTTGALRSLNDGELEVLLAHELGHQVLHHPVKAMEYSSLSQGKLRQAHKCMENEDIVQMVAYYAEAMELAVVSKRQEKQADIWAAELLGRHGRNMQIAVALWQRMKMLYGEVPNDSNHLSYHERQKIYMSDYGR